MPAGVQMPSGTAPNAAPYHQPRWSCHTHSTQHWRALPPPPPLPLTCSWTRANRSARSLRHVSRCTSPAAPSTCSPFSFRPTSTKGSALVGVGGGGRVGGVGVGAMHSEVGSRRAGKVSQLMRGGCWEWVDGTCMASSRHIATQKCSTAPQQTPEPDCGPCFWWLLPSLSTEDPTW